MMTFWGEDINYFCCLLKKIKNICILPLPTVPCMKQIVLFCQKSFSNDTEMPCFLTRFCFFFCFNLRGICPKYGSQLH